MDVLDYDPLPEGFLFFLCYVSTGFKDEANPNPNPNDTKQAFMLLSNVYKLSSWRRMLLRMWHIGSKSNKRGTK